MCTVRYVHKVYIFVCLSNKLSFCSYTRSLFLPLLEASSLVLSASLARLLMASFHTKCFLSPNFFFPRTSGPFEYRIVWPMSAGPTRLGRRQKTVSRETSCCCRVHILHLHPRDPSLFDVNLYYDLPGALVRGEPPDRWRLGASRMEQQTSLLFNLVHSETRKIRYLRPQDTFALLAASCHNRVR